MQRKRVGEEEKQSVLAKEEDEILGFHCSTGGRGGGMSTGRVQDKDRWFK